MEMIGGLNCCSRSWGSWMTELILKPKAAHLCVEDMWSGDRSERITNWGIEGTKGTHILKKASIWCEKDWADDITFRCDCFQGLQWELTSFQETLLDGLGNGESWTWFGEFVVEPVQELFSVWRKQHSERQKGQSPSLLGNCKDSNTLFSKLSLMYSMGETTQCPSTPMLWLFCLSSPHISFPTFIISLLFYSLLLPQKPQEKASSTTISRDFESVRCRVTLKETCLISEPWLLSTGVNWLMECFIHLLMI